MLKKCDVCGTVFDGRPVAKRCSAECRRAYKDAYNRAYRQTPEHKAYERAYARARRQTPERKAYERAYKQTPEYKAYDRALHRRAKTTRRLIRMAAMADVVRDAASKVLDGV